VPCALFIRPAASRADRSERMGHWSMKRVEPRWRGCRKRSGWSPQGLKSQRRVKIYNGSGMASVSASARFRNSAGNARQALHRTWISTGRNRGRHIVGKMALAELHVPRAPQLPVRSGHYRRGSARPSRGPRTRVQMGCFEDCLGVIMNGPPSLLVPDYESNIYRISSCSNRKRGNLYRVNC